MDPEPLISREEVTATLFLIADIREVVAEIRDWLVGEDDGEASEENT